MKVVMAVWLLVAVCFVGLSYASMPDEPEHRERFALLNMVKYCDLVVTGTVTQMDYVVRERVLPNGGGAFTTDITIAVDETIKGSPNDGDGSTVKFMILGGRGVDPRTGKRLRMEVSGQPEFTVNEQVMVFLKQADPNDSACFARNFAHEGYYIVGATYGKRTIENNTVDMLYGDVDNELTPVEVPVDLALILGKASLKDAAGATELENVIKGLANGTSEGGLTLSAATIDDLKQRAQRIVNAPPKK